LGAFIYHAEHEIYQVLESHFSFPGKILRPLFRAVLEAFCVDRIPNYFGGSFPVPYVFFNILSLLFYFRLIFLPAYSLTCWHWFYNRFKPLLQARHGTGEGSRLFRCRGFFQACGKLPGHGYKGRPVRVVGRLKQSRWINAEGKSCSRILIVAEHIDYCPDFNKQDDTFDFEEQEAVLLK